MTEETMAETTETTTKGQATAVFAGGLFKALVANADATRAGKKDRGSRPTLGYARLTIIGGVLELWTTDSYQALRQEVHSDCEPDHRPTREEAIVTAPDDVDIVVDVDDLVRAVKTLDTQRPITVTVTKIDTAGRCAVAVDDGELTLPVAAPDVDFPKVETLYWDAATDCSRGDRVHAMTLGVARLTQLSKLKRAVKATVDKQPITFHNASTALKPVCWEMSDVGNPRLTGIVMPVKVD